MANPEQPSSVAFFNERGNKAITRLDPKKYTLEQLEQITKGMIESTLNGRPMRVNIVFQEGKSILSEKDFAKKRTPEELKSFIGISALHMKFAKAIFILRQLNPKPIGDPFEEFITKDLGVKY